MVKITIDKGEYEVEEGENLLQACLSSGINLPYFCWHPAMGSVGACRQCAVVVYQDENDERGRLVMGCMTPVAEGQRVSVATPQAVDFRASVIEWLMLNHPHDCPVCEEGGECHLQDMTVMTGHTSRRYSGKKRTFENQYLGPFINHEMNRCITCYRCVRFYRDYAGGDDLQALGSRNRMYFGRMQPGSLESEFSGNLVEVCPTGVFTNKPFSESYTRKWDLQSAPSICMGCAVGCNTSPGERYGRLKRIQNRYNPDINGYFLCDRGRFGAGYVNYDKRIRQAGYQLSDGSYQAIDQADALARLSDMVAQGEVLAIGSPRASIESNYALRALVGEQNYSAGFSDAEQGITELALKLLESHPVQCPSLKQVEAADAVLILGEDVSNTAPRLALALRQTARNESLEMAGPASIPLWQDAGVRGHAQSALTPIYSLNVLPTRIDNIATQTQCASPEGIANVAQAIVAALTNSESSASHEASADFVAAAANALRSAKRPLIVSGTSLLDGQVLLAAFDIAQALRTHNSDCQSDLLLCFPEVNSVGSGLMPGGLSMNQALQKLVDGQAGTVLVLENDLYRRADAQLVDAALGTAKNVVAMDVLETPTLEKAALVLPSASFAESEGTCINFEGRAQHYYRVFEPEGDIKASWRWLSNLAEMQGDGVQGVEVLNGSARESLLAQCADEISCFAGLAQVAPPAEYRVLGEAKIPRQTHRFSGRTAMNADKSVHEPKTTVDEQSPFSFSMEGNSSAQSGSMAPFVWAPGWNSNQSVSQFQEGVGGELKGARPAVFVLTPGSGTRSDIQTGTRTSDQRGLTLVPLYDVFGSDELSAHTKEVAQRAAEQHLTIGVEDARQLGVKNGDGLLSANPGQRAQAQITYAVVVNENMLTGCIGYIAGLKGSAFMQAGERMNFERDPNWVPKVEPEVIARG